MGRLDSRAKILLLVAQAHELSALNQRTRQHCEANGTEYADKKQARIHGLVPIEFPASLDQELGMALGYTH